MSLIPAAAITSASPSFAQVMPIAPAASCMRASNGGLVSLRAGAQAGWAVAEENGHAVNIRLHPLDVETQGRRVELQLRRADKSGCDGDGSLGESRTAEDLADGRTYGRTSNNVSSVLASNR